MPMLFPAYARLAGGLLACLLGGAAPALAGSTYVIDQRYGTLTFEIEEAGLFTSKGIFHRFAGELTLDFEHPAQSRIDVMVEAASADIPGPGAIDMLRSPDYFDVQQHPNIHFVSTAIRPLGGERYHIDGTAELRGVTKPQSFEAVLTKRPAEGPGAGGVADFLVTGGLLRSEFGMVADQNFIGDAVRLVIRLQLSVPPDAHGF